MNYDVTEMKSSAWITIVILQVMRSWEQALLIFWTWWYKVIAKERNGRFDRGNVCNLKYVFALSASSDDGRDKWSFIHRFQLLNFLEHFRSFDHLTGKKITQMHLVIYPEQIHLKIKIEPSLHWSVCCLLATVRSTLKPKLNNLEYNSSTFGRSCSGCGVKSVPATLALVCLFGLRPWFPAWSP